MSNKKRLSVVRKKYDTEITDFYKNFTSKLKKKGPKYGPNNTNPPKTSYKGGATIIGTK